tara:strand:- start:730 stop:1065 length:336 start_codon:yes stop_codon:yes gene_type:complete
MKCTAAQTKAMKASPSKWDEKYKNQETIVYKVYTDGGSYVGITGSNPKAIELRFVDHITRFSKDGIQITGLQTLHTFSNRFLALEMEHLLRPKANIGLNRNPGGIRGYHWK